MKWTLPDCWTFFLSLGFASLKAVRPPIYVVRKYRFPKLFTSFNKMPLPVSFIISFDIL